MTSESNPAHRTIRLAIVDDHPIMRSGLVATFEAEADILVVGKGGSADDALQIAAEQMPDIMVLDLSMPGCGLNALSAIAATYPAIKIIVVTMHEDATTIRSAILAGASGYLSKGIASSELVAAVHAVARGEPVLPRAVASSLIEPAAATTNSTVSPLSELTERERQILSALAHGSTNREIGQSLGLAEKTVKNYLTNILRKLHVRRRVEAAVMSRSQRD